MEKEYVLVRSKRKTICISIGRDGKLVVKAPLITSVARIDAFVNKNKTWIENKLAKMQSIEAEKGRFLGEPDTVTYLGTNYRIVEMDIAEFKFFESFVACPKGFSQKDLISFFKKSALEYFTQRVKEFAERYGFKYSCVKLSDANKRWGYCTAKGVIGLEWRLMAAPKNVVDSVIVHELCHTEELNHGKKFWAKVFSVMPDYKDCKTWLNENAYLLDIYR